MKCCLGVLLLLNLSLCACERPKTASEHNAFKDYVNEPKKKAVDVKERLESAQDRARENALQAMDEEDKRDDDSEDE